MKSLCLVLLVAAAAALAVTLPDRDERLKAVGSLDRHTPAERRAFTDAGEFEAKKAPQPADWLASHPEPGQSLGQYLDSKPNFPDDTRKILYVLPLGEFEEGKAPSLEALKDYTAAYFQPLEVRMLKPVAEADIKVTSRINPGSGKKQWNSQEMLKGLAARLPADAYAMLAVTMTDLYPDESWNFVFGQASIRNRVGIFSFARYHPSWTGREADEHTETLVLRRAAKVLTHEMGHMFGIRHCIHYECNMNGANHLQEADSTPMHLCPVCLRKLWYAAKFDPAKRYGALGDFYTEHGLEEESEWVEKRLESIQEAR
ncbi:Zn-dependent protease-like protein [Haloferula helveola]|uniref:Zn-dependent protease-like protein n=1 Tax=Haloferula helveola TaxID=490095 RepID=A0ABM7RCF9_9BACT|nr:Zn-dependent protease-like protein [Haloferula helveola]